MLKANIINDCMLNSYTHLVFKVKFLFLFHWECSSFSLGKLKGELTLLCPIPHPPPATGSSKPLHWAKPIYELDLDDPGNNGFLNEDFIVWMRTAAFPTFKKLYRRLKRVHAFAEGLPAGNYSLSISYSILLCHAPSSEWRQNLATSCRILLFCVCPPSR